MIIYNTSVYWTTSIFFAVVDLKNWPRKLCERKIQKNSVVNSKIYIQTSIYALQQQVFIFLPQIYIFCEFLMPWRYNAIKFSLNGLEWWSSMVSFFICVFIREILFFWGHLILHNPMLYKWVHKLHHDFTAPIGVSAIYAHPIENSFINFLPVLVGPFLLGSHPFFYTMFVCFVSFNSVYSHSGYDIPGLPMGSHHDFHHMNFEGNYGIIGLMDHVWNTDGKFLLMVQKQFA
eukprot:TRINITY_DN19367_c0_g1_i3.p1 TRINITY_DN19367_c0_g1~~TRINITY_DN19367_c0_g1_i3.p1  ORF type:complete len:232 (-),score=10.36 TRINITY_DN19367_c0_g1_i3:252-947(-)